VRGEAKPFKRTAILSGEGEMEPIVMEVDCVV
jgi:hypothetical protein